MALGGVTLNSLTLNAMSRVRLIGENGKTTKIGALTVNQSTQQWGGRYYGGHWVIDSVNAIQIQTWVVLIANLLITVLSRNIKRNCAFSQVVTMLRLTLMYYINFIAFMEEPDKTWNDMLDKKAEKALPGLTLFD